MVYKIIEQWHFNDVSVLRLDHDKKVTSPSNDYRNYLINGITYKPVPMSHPRDDFIAIKSTGNFVGKEVEFIK